ncbi:MAG TPA: helix-turn-helix domain-containing protein, partial [Acidimicrobiales bacterium]
RRREMAGETRQRIVQAGSDLLHGSSVRDWGSLTIRAVAERAGVHERTVYRHFTNERGLRDAVMAQLEAESGIVLEGMQLEDVGKVARRILEQVATFPFEPRPELDPTLTAANQRQHAALLDAVAAGAPAWSLDERSMAAGILDVLWSVSAFERLVRDWQLDPEHAAHAIDWVIAMVETAIREGRSPNPSPALDAPQGRC